LQKMAPKCWATSIDEVIFPVDVRSLPYMMSMQYQHVICIEWGSFLISRTFCGRIGSIFLQFWRYSDAGWAVIPLDSLSKLT
jgi:hypothetical protein